MSETSNVTEPGRLPSTIEPAKSFASRRITSWVVWGSAILAIAALLFFGPGVLGSWARFMASRQLDRGAISAAQQWLAWSDRFSPGDGRTNLLRATCFRHLRQQDHFVKELESARKNGLPPAQIRQELRLSEIQSGQLVEGAESELLDLIQGGVSQHDACATFIYGYLYRQEPEKAKRILDAWAADFPYDANVAYMLGIYQRSLGEQAQAETEFQTAVEREPRHELARMALAELYEEQDRVTRSLEAFINLARLFPTSEPARVSLARLLRKTGRVDEARAVLASLASRAESNDEVQWEMSEIEIESGNYKEAGRRLKQAHLDQMQEYKSLLDRATLFAMQGYSTSAEPLFLKARTAATTMALEGRVGRAEWLFDRVDATYSRLRRIHDLRVRLGIDPNNNMAAEEMQRLDAFSGNSASSAASDQTAQDRLASVATSGPELYALHCAVCHGTNGAGNGRAARHLFPRPRDFRSERFRLVSTGNAVPTPADIDAVIKRGLPGTSMPPFLDFSEQQRKVLVEEVLRLHREGLRERLIKLHQDAEERIDNNELSQLVQLHTTPGEVVSIPKIGPADAPSINRGRALYLRHGCSNCHENELVDSKATAFFDEHGRPTQARDLARDPFKGGSAPESIYLRIRLGMPGTAHPACGSISEGEIVDLVQFCRSLSQEPKRMLTNHQRRELHRLH